jgi:hypothetical protein
MERRVKVNAGTLAAVTPDGLPRGWSAAQEGGEYARPAPGLLAPCLYLGPRGERCKRQAVAGGFCAIHDPHRRKTSTAPPARFWAVAGAIAALVWPYVEFAVREIIGWTRSH